MTDQNPPCLACGGVLTNVLKRVADTRFGIDAEFRIARCGACGLEQTLPRPSLAELNALYSKHYNFNGEKGTTYTGLRGLFLSSPFYRMWARIDGDISFHGRKGMGRLIDVGCNEGRGLTHYARNGFTAVEGLETNPVAADTARQRGFLIYGVELSEFHPTQIYDVAVLSNVLEHALNPAEMLRHVARIVRPGGEVWISCPNAASWLRHLFGRAWINWHVPFHIVHFSDQTLSCTLERSGFESIEQTQVTPSLWVAHSLLAATAHRGRTTRVLRNPFAIILLMSIARFVLFPALWFGNRLGRGDCLIRIARRG